MEISPWRKTEGKIQLDKLNQGYLMIERVERNIRNYKVQSCQDRGTTCPKTAVLGSKAH